MTSTPPNAYEDFSDDQASDVSRSLNKSSTSYTPYGATAFVPQTNTTSIPSTITSLPVTRLPVGVPVQPIKPAPPEQSPLKSLLTSCLCELVATFLLTFAVACCPKGIWVPTATAAIVVALMYAFGRGCCPGAHLNPAISFAVVLAGKMSISACVAYILAQVVGCLLGGLLFRASFGVTSLAVAVMPMAPFSFGAAAAAEMIYSTMLCFVALNVMYSSTLSQNHFYAIAVGFVIVAGGYAAYAISGAVLNPALSLAFSLNGNLGWGAWYILFELGGGLIAALFFRICRSNEYHETHMLYEIEAGDYQTIYDVASLDPPSLRVRMLSEFMGTFWLLVTYGLNTVLMTGATAWSAAAALVSLMYALATVSGGHFNPAVTLAVVLSGRSKCSGRDGRYYVISQLVAALIAGLFVSYIHNHGSTPKSHVGLFYEYSSYGWGPVCVVEFLFTYVLAFVVLTVATSEAHTTNWPNFYFALAVGLTLVGAAYASGDVSGGYLNPAVVFEFAVEGEPSFNSHADVKGWPAWLDSIMRVLAVVFAFIVYWCRCFVYWIPELLGACAAAATFRVVYSAEYRQKMLQ